MSFDVQPSIYFALLRRKQTYDKQELILVLLIAVLKNMLRIPMPKGEDSISYCEVLTFAFRY